MGERAARPFWVHQAAEYLIGIALVSQALQDPQPVVPAVAGTVVIVNAAIVRGPLGAFKWIGRRHHRWFDIGVMVAIVIGAFQPWVEVTAAGQAIMLVCLMPLGFLWFYTDWAERPARVQRRKMAAGDTGEHIGRSAGRLAGSGYASAKNAIKQRSKD